MGYVSRLTGSIAIDPPLNHAERKTINLDYLTVEEEREVTESDLGTTTIIRGVALLPRWEDEAKYYGIDDDVERVARAFPDRTFTGWLVRDGEEQGDVQRYTIRDGHLVTENAELRWPDGTKVEL